jgi:hypothetical protein
MRAGAPSVLVAYGAANVEALYGCRHPGRLVRLSSERATLER